MIVRISISSSNQSSLKGQRRFVDALDASSLSVFLVYAAETYLLEPHEVVRDPEEDKKRWDI